MPRLRAALLQPGMVVTADVQNSEGMLLIPAGTSLTERQISILGSWGITDVEVGASEIAAAGGPLERLSPEAAEKLKGEVKGIFWELDETNPVQMEIFKLALERKAMQLLESSKS